MYLTRLLAYSLTHSLIDSKWTWCAPAASCRWRRRTGTRRGHCWQPLLRTPTSDRGSEESQPRCESTTWQTTNAALKTAFSQPSLDISGKSFAS